MTRLYCLAYVFPLVVLRLATGQVSNAIAQQPASNVGHPVLFGTNVNLESSPSTKGVQLALGAHQPDKGTNAGKKKRGELAVAPIPLVNPSIGHGAGLGVLYAVQLDGDESSPPSTVGAGGFGTGRGSWGAAVGAQLHLKSDRYRIAIGGGGGEFNYNYFGNWCSEWQCRHQRSAFTTVEG